MERLRDREVSSSVHVRLPLESEQGFLRFTRQLNEYRNAEDMLQALPADDHAHTESTGGAQLP